MDGFYRGLAKLFPWGKKKEAAPEEKPKSAECTKDYAEPEVVGESTILTKEEIDYLDYRLSHGMLINTWTLAYTTESNGYSLNTLYSSIGREYSGPIVLVFKDRNGHRFGAFLREAFRPNGKLHSGCDCLVFRLKHQDFAEKYSQKFVTNKSSDESADLDNAGSSCVDNVAESGCQDEPNNGNKVEDVHGEENKLDNAAGGSLLSEAGCSSSNGCEPSNGNETIQKSNEELDDDLSPDHHMKQYDFYQHKIWRWDRDGNCYIHGTKESLHIGSQDGKVSLWVDDSLNNGRSEYSPFFKNEPLAPCPKCHTDHFKICKVELWKVN